MENTNGSNQSAPTDKKTLRNSGGVLVLGILSIIFCCPDGIPGLVIGIIALVEAGKAKDLYHENPSLYLKSSYNRMIAGWICAIIGTSLSGISFIYTRFFVRYFNWDFFNTLICQ